ncbi:DUF5723 family protein [Marinoscillum furvescens]|uniref:DUF5723 domain-containing protein n=1 Tax=Marinoscillum furvescens DSM 4134 TaxID=1122208 RepID=A0A3D9L7D5_MARFU|nr:DUF5723 family protein [Marinoscillum furvescens]REE00407.1 hypothetical protein C7460_10528 [Marinoscillum furvescens DSM 4134]
MNSKKITFKLLMGCLVLLISTAGSAQTSLSFHHLGNATFQNTNLNPALMPEGKFFLGLPVISGVHLNFNNKFDYSDVVVKSESESQISLNSFLGSLQQNNMTHVSSTISLLHVGFRTPSGLTFSFFANDRIEADFLYKKKMMQMVIEGNGSVLNETIDLSKTKVSATYFRELGISAGATIPRLDMTLAARLKYIQGIANASTSRDANATFRTDDIDYSLQLELQNATLNTAGFDAVQENPAYAIANSNVGGALDLGMNWNMNRYYTISASIVDLGMISWKEGVKNHHLRDTSMVYGGLDLKDPENLEQTIKDTLINKLKNRREKNQDPYTTFLNPKAYVSWAYHTPTAGDLVATAGTRYVRGQMKFMFGAGYRHKIGKAFIGSVNVTKLPQQFLNLGAAIAVNGGPTQLYLAADQLVNFDATKFKSFDFRIGLNIQIGKKVEEMESSFAVGANKRKRDRSRSSSQSFLGNKVRVKGKEGIYTIITKQGRRKRKDFLRKSDPIPKEGNEFRMPSPPQDK